MFIKQRVGHIALMLAGAAMFAASGNAQEAGLPKVPQYEVQTQFQQFPFLNDPSLLRAAQVTNWGTLVALQGGWGIDRMLVFHAIPIVNADPPCSITTNGYIVNETHSGHNLFNTMLLTALLNRREVQFVILGCYENRPQIVSVSIR